MSKIDDICANGAKAKFSGRGPISSDLRSGYAHGFAAAFNLQLPVLFAKYLSDNFKLRPELGWIKISDGEWLEEEEIYKDWLNNIYTPNP